MPASRTWSTADSNDCTTSNAGGGGYFSINPGGDLRVEPSRDAERSVGLKDISDRLKQRGYDLPVLLRFNGILRDRLCEMHDCFREAIRNTEYQQVGRTVIPVVEKFSELEGNKGQGKGRR